MNTTATLASELSYDVFQAAFEPRYWAGQFQSDDDAVATMIEVLDEYSAEEVEACTREALSVIASDNA